MSAIIEVKYFNSFWGKQVQGSGTYNDPKWPGLDWNPYGYPTFPIQATNDSDNWYIEEARIKGGYNNTIVSQGVRAYLNEEDPNRTNRESSLIYSGVYNSRTGINDTNVFSIGENITRDLDPANGSIQKLYAENTNLIIFQENKVTYSLINKNTIYSGTQGSNETASSSVIGQNVPYAGTFGIGKNPESFAKFGFRKYFADPLRGSIMRLSADGLTEISNYGMKDFFRDSLQAINNNFKKRNLPWTLAIDPPVRILKNAPTIQIPNSDLTFVNYQFIAFGTFQTTLTAVTGQGSGATSAATIPQPPAGTSGIIVFPGFNGGGFGYKVGDVVKIVGDGVKFTGDIQFTLTSSMLVDNTLQNPIYIQENNECEIFMGCSVLNIDSNQIAVDTSTIITNIQKFYYDPSDATKYYLAVSTRESITPTATGLFSYEYQSRIVGGWDNHNRYYTVSMQPDPSYVDGRNSFITTSFDETVKGWVSLYSYKPSFIFSLKGLYFSTHENYLYQHYLNNSSNSNYLNYYDIRYGCYLSLVINANPSTKKNFQTINYEGNNGWEISGLQSDITGLTNGNVGFVDSAEYIYSYEKGLYIDPTNGFPQRAGFDRKENLYVAKINNKSSIRVNEVLGGNQVSGVKGYLLNAVINIDNQTNVGGPKEIWSVGTTFVQSS
tara:strand:- start:2084 stop:4075 length:1992 start_codon:yes stop_codon:yes gene_type:complete